MKRPACNGCEFDGKCLTQRLGYGADCPEVINFEYEDIEESHFDINPDFEDQ
jgi:hypothetical protein